MAKIGIMGGTFDPIHNGHLLLGKQAYEEFALEQIWFMPSGVPPHKQEQRVTDIRFRCDMVKLAVKDDSHFVFSDFEANREGTTYTADTLQKLRAIYPHHEFFLIVGADSLYQIESWYRPEIVLSNAIILAADREYGSAASSLEEQMSYLRQKYQAVIHQLHAPRIDVSSEQLRQMAAAGGSITLFVPEEIANYIRNQHLYEVKKCDL